MTGGLAEPGLFTAVSCALEGAALQESRRLGCPRPGGDPSKGLPAPGVPPAPREPVTGGRHAGWAVGVQRLPLPDSWHPSVCFSQTSPCVVATGTFLELQKRSSEMSVFHWHPPLLPHTVGRAFLEVAKAQGLSFPHPVLRLGWGCRGSGRQVSEHPGL